MKVTYDKKHNSFNINYHIHDWVQIIGLDNKSYQITDYNLSNGMYHLKNDYRVRSNYSLKPFGKTKKEMRRQINKLKLLNLLKQR